MRQIIVFAALLAVALGHSWMQVPLGGYAQLGVPSANQTAQCGFNGNYVAPTAITAGNLLSVSWALNTHGGETTPVTLRLLDVNLLPVTTLTTVPFNTNGGNIDVRIPFDQAGGDFFLQWVWLDFFTCSRLQIAPSNIAVTVVPANDTLVNGAAQPATIEYYNFVGNANNQNFLVTINGPTGPKFLEIYTGGNKVGIPTAQNFTERFDTSVIAEVAFGVCNDGNLQDLFVGVQGSAATTGEAYTVKASSYNSLVNVGTVFNSGAHNGHRYFSTQSFETFGEPRRVVVSATAPITTPTFDLLLDTTCSFNSKNLVTGSKIGDSVGCIQLSTKQGTKFIQVPPINSAYTIRTENGLCGDISSGSYIQASLALLLALIGALVM